MKILAIDTSGPNCCVAVIDEDKVIANFDINIGRTHSETLLPLVEALEKFTNLTLNDIDVFACCVGPGSFTGIRIGIATIKGFALSLNKPVISVSTLESLAYNVLQYDKIICSILDARNNNVYAAFYKYDGTLKMIGNYQTNSINELVDEVKKLQDKILFIGNGAISYQKILQNELNENAIFVPKHLNEQSAVSVARIAIDKYNRNELDSAYELHPLYLRKSQAERTAESNFVNKT